MSINNFFKVREIQKIQDLKVGDCIAESDLAIQTEQLLIQFDYKSEDKAVEKNDIRPGCFNFIEGIGGLKLNPTILKHYHLLESINNTATIINEANKFFTRLHIYQELKKEPKRAILLHSQPGQGKTATINLICQQFLKEQDTTIIIWDTSRIDSSAVNSFFLNYSKFVPEVKKFILIIEDIGGGSIDNHNYDSSRGVDSSLLNLLDGISSPFQGVPTFVIATTNNPETSVEALIDRPGRFDLVLELKSPNLKETCALLKFIQKKDTLEESEIEAARLASNNAFSIAHIEEMVIRAKLDDITLCEVAHRLIAHKKAFKNAFIKTPLRGIGL